jgi:mitochondrial fission protein ELM1
VQHFGTHEILADALIAAQKHFTMILQPIVDLVVGGVGRKFNWSISMINKNSQAKTALPV